jgi:hypothetical protein
VRYPSTSIAANVSKAINVRNVATRYGFSVEVSDLLDFEGLALKADGAEVAPLFVAESRHRA